MNKTVTAKRNVGVDVGKDNNFELESQVNDFY